MKHFLLSTMVFLALASGMNLYAEEPNNISKGTLVIGENSYNLEEDYLGGTAWTWTANTSTLILGSGYVAGTIQFNCQLNDSIILVFQENTTIESATKVPIQCNGALTIKGDDNETLTLINTGKEANCYALYSQRLLSIHEGILDLRAAGSSVMMDGSFNAKAAALYAAGGLKVIGKAQLTVTVTGNDATGILLTGDGLTSTIEVEDKTITANSTGAGAAIWIDTGHTMKLKRGFLDLSNDKGSNLIQGNGGYDMLGGQIQYNNGPAPRLTGINIDKGKLGDIALLTGTNLTDTIKIWVDSHETQLKRQDGDGNDNGNWKLSFLIPAGERADSATIIVESDGGRAALAKAFLYTATSYRVNLFVPTEASINDGIKYIDVEENGMITELPSATQANCVFRGWSKEETTFVPWNMEHIVEGNTQLYGQFVPKPTLAPAANEWYTPLDAPITAAFSSSMTVVSLDYISISSNLEDVRVSMNENVLTIDHAPFTYNTTYTVTIPKGTFEEYPEDITWTFSTYTETNYHNVELEVAEGIHCEYASGSHTIADGQYFFLTFSPDYTSVTAEDILFLVDGKETEFRVSTDGRGGSYLLSSITSDHAITIALRQYPVTFPTIEGLTITAEKEAVYGEPFTFSISSETLDLSEMKVLVNDNELPSNALRTQSYTYTIDKVEGPLTITLEGVRTTSNATISEGEITLSTVNSQLSIVNSTGKPVDVAVYTITGKSVVLLRALSGSRSIALPSGIYVVRAGNTVTKVMIH